VRPVQRDHRHYEHEHRRHDCKGFQHVRRAARDLAASPTTSFPTIIGNNPAGGSGTLIMKERLMTNDLVTYETDDGWGDAAAEYNDTLNRGEFLKCPEGFWSVGKEGSALPRDTRLVATSTTAAWVKWSGNRPVESHIRRPGEQLAEREELGDLDESAWEAGPDGRPRDPWQNTRYCYFVNPEAAAVYTYSTSSWSGRSAVSGLGDQIARMRLARPGSLPIVEFDSAPHKTKFGLKRKPILRIVGWVGGDLSAAAPDIKRLPSRNGGAPYNPPVVDEMADSIPY
jgi:hypothetical protein